MVCFGSCHPFCSLGKWTFTIAAIFHQEIGCVLRYGSAEKDTANPKCSHVNYLSITTICRNCNVCNHSASELRGRRRTTPTQIVPSIVTEICGAVTVSVGHGIITFLQCFASFLMLLTPLESSSCHGQNEWISLSFRPRAQQSVKREAHIMIPIDIGLALWVCLAYSLVFSTNYETCISR